VCQSLNLAEKDYFGLRYVDSENQRVSIVVVIGIVMKPKCVTVFYIGRLKMRDWKMEHKNVTGSYA